MRNNMSSLFMWQGGGVITTQAVNGSSPPGHHDDDDDKAMLLIPSVVKQEKPDPDQVARAKRKPAKKAAAAASRRRLSAARERDLSQAEYAKLMVRRQRNKEAAARCRKRRVDLTERLQAEVSSFEAQRRALEEEIQGLNRHKEDLQLLLQAHQHQDCCQLKQQQQHHMRMPPAAIPRPNTLDCTGGFGGPGAVIAADPVPSLETPSTFMRTFDNSALASSEGGPMGPSQAVPVATSSPGGSSTSCSWQEQLTVMGPEADFVAL